MSAGHAGSGDTAIDARVSCDRCAAVCCRLTVVIVDEDNVPAHLVDRASAGPTIMARAADGWCVALDRKSMRCGIYADRPVSCRRFAMGGAYCRAERAAFPAKLPSKP